MKNIIRIAAVCGLLVSIQSCNDGEELIDDLQDTVERGAILRTVQVLSNEFPFDQPDTAEFSVILEEQDQEDGALLESVDVFATFTDGSPDEGDSSGGIVGQEVSVRTISASEFSPGPFGLPRTTLTITLAELLNLVNLTADDIFGGDNFNTRLVLNLTDGRSFTTTDVNGNIASGSFFLSPFQYNTPVVCPVGAEEFIGNYSISNIVQSDFGNIYAEGNVVELAIPEEGTSVDRFFEAVALEDLGIGQPATPLVFQMVCNSVIVLPGQSTNLGCGGSLLLGPPISRDPGTYATGDDSAFNIVIGYNASGEATCASPLDIEIALSKQ